MGWSCSAKASRVLEAWQAACVESTNMSNVWREPEPLRHKPIGRRQYFWEASSKEHASGAVTGSIFRELTTVDSSDTRCCTKVGSFRISGDGSIARAPKFLKRAALNARPVVDCMTGEVLP